MTAEEEEEEEAEGGGGRGRRFRRAVEVEDDDEEEEQDEEVGGGSPLDEAFECGFETRVGFFVCFLHPFPELLGKFVVTPFANGLQVQFEELGFFVHRDVARAAGKVTGAPGKEKHLLVQLRCKEEANVSS